MTSYLPKEDEKENTFSQGQAKFFLRKKKICTYFLVSIKALPEQEIIMITKMFQNVQHCYHLLYLNDHFTT